MLLDCLDRPTLAAEMMARFELLLLDELGFGLDLTACAATGRRDDLVYVSPKSGRGGEPGRGLAYRTASCRCRRSCNAPGETSERTKLEQAFVLTGYLSRAACLRAARPRRSGIRLNFLRAISRNP